MNPTITALLIFGGTVQVIADLIVIDKAFGITARAKYAWLRRRDLRRSRAFNLALIKKGRAYCEGRGIDYAAVQELVGVKCNG